MAIIQDVRRVKAKDSNRHTRCSWRTNKRLVDLTNFLDSLGQLTLTLGLNGELKVIWLDHLIGTEEYAPR
jgi:hypothetical protein